MSVLFLGLSKSASISLGIVLSLAIWYYVYKVRQKIVLPDEDGMTRLEPNMFIAIAGLICCLPYLALVVHTIYTATGGVSQIGNGLKIFLCIFLFPVFVYGYYHLRLFLYHRLEFDKTKLIISDMYGKKTEMAWSNLIGVDHYFSLLPCQRFALQTNLYKYKIDVDMVGFKVFEEYLREQNPGVGELLQWKLYHRPIDII